MSLNTLERGPPPQDMITTYAVLDGLTQSRAATMDLLTDRRWPGGEVAGVEALRPNPVRLAQAATGTMSDFGPAIPGFAVPKGAVIVEGAIITAAAVLAAIDVARERAAVEGVIRRYGLDRGSAADMLAARAYVWTVWMAPMSHWALPYAGPENARAAEMVMRYEQAHPGTTGLAVSGRSRAAMAAIDGLIDDAVSGGSFPEPMERTSAVDPALGTTSTAARSILRLQPRQQWVAHHLIPFGVMAALPVAFQKAVAASGWQMDSVENLIALPGNLQTFFVQPPPQLPYQQGPHPRYDAAVTASLAVIAAGAQPSGTPALRAALLAVEQGMRSSILAGRYNPRLR